MNSIKKVIFILHDQIIIEKARHLSLLMNIHSGMQLPLAFGQTEAFSFEQFLAGGSVEAVQKLQDISLQEDHATAETVFLWGAEGSGKSHLLQALCKALSDNGKQSLYLPLLQVQKFTPQILEGLESLPVICLDDIDHIAGDEMWEQAIFHLFNRIKDAGSLLIMAANTAPQSIQFTLADLASRVNWGLIYQLHDLDDTEKLAVLQNRASDRSFELPDEVGEYLIKRLPRDMHGLCDFLDKLDVASLAAKRKLTIPFVRDLMENNL